MLQWAQKGGCALPAGGDAQVRLLFVTVGIHKGTEISPAFWKSKQAALTITSDHPRSQEILGEDDPGSFFPSNSLKQWELSIQVPSAIQAPSFVGIQVVGPYKPKPVSVPPAPPAPVVGAARLARGIPAPHHAPHDL